MKIQLLLLLTLIMSSLIYAQDNIQVLEAAVRTTQKTAGEKHLDYANALINLAEGYQESKEWDRAKEQLIRVAAIIESPRDEATTSQINKTKIAYYFIEWKGAFKENSIAPNKILPYDWYEDCVKYGEEDKIENIVEMAYSKASFYSKESYQYWKMAKRALDDTVRTHVAQTNRMYRLLLEKATAEFGVESNAAIGVLYGQMTYNERRGDSLLVEELRSKVAANWGVLNPTGPQEGVIFDEEAYPCSITYEMPRFTGCEHLDMEEEDKQKCSDKKLRTFIYEQIEYPVSARDCGVEGVAVIGFTVSEYGYLYDIKLLRDPGFGLELEAKRIVETMNEMPFRWIPCKRKNRAVRTKKAVPVVFKLH